MEPGFDEQWAQSTVAELKAQGIKFADGFSEAEIETIDREFNLTVPRELALFLGVGVPVSPNWARWVDGPEVVAADAHKWLQATFEFDIRNSGYWHDSFGEQPAEHDAAVERALEVVASAPPMIPIFSHRFLCTAPVDGPRAVLSVYQAVDSIFYGNDLADYFAREFHVSRPEWATVAAPPVPVWQDLFELFDPPVQ